MHTLPFAGLLVGSLCCAACSRGGAIDPGDGPQVAPDSAAADAGDGDLRPGADLRAGGWADFRLVEAARFPVEPGPHAMVVADLNGDGRPDIVVGGITNKRVVAYLNQGGLKFQAGADRLAVAGFPAWLAAADLDRDGKTDIAVATFLGHTQDVLRGDGAGRLSSLRSLPVGADHYPNHVAVADLDGDGAADLISGELGAGNMGKTIGLLYGTGPGTFASPVAQPAGTGAASAAAADLDGDGRLDLVTADYGGNGYTVLLGQGSRRFAAPRTTAVQVRPRILQIADLNRDGRPDLAMSLDMNPGKVAVFLGVGDGTFGEQDSPGVGAGPYGLGVGDLNNDGLPDLYTADIDGGSASVLLGQGDGRFAPARSIPTCDAYGIGAADFDGDGKPDLAVVCLNAGEVVILRNESR